MVTHCTPGTCRCIWWATRQQLTVGVQLARILVDHLGLVLLHQLHHTWSLGRYSGLGFSFQLFVAPSKEDQESPVYSFMSLHVLGSWNWPGSVLVGLCKCVCSTWSVHWYSFSQKTKYTRLAYSSSMSNIGLHCAQYPSVNFFCGGGVER
jgi:hypothetical protein